MVDKPPAPKEEKPTPEEEALDKEIFAMFAAAEAEVKAEEEAAGGGGGAVVDDAAGAAKKPTVAAADGTQIPFEPVSDAAKKEWSKMSGGAPATAVPTGTPSKVSPALQRFNLDVPKKK